MPKCRKCNAEIKTLSYNSYKIEKGVFNGDTFEDSYPEEEIVFSCPICDDQLFDNEGKAREFLATPMELSGNYEKFTNEQLKYILRTVLQVLGERIVRKEIPSKTDASPFWKIQSYLEKCLSEDPSPILGFTLEDLNGRR